MEHTGLKLTITVLRVRQKLVAEYLGFLEEYGYTHPYLSFILKKQSPLGF